MLFLKEYKVFILTCVHNEFNEFDVKYRGGGSGERATLLENYVYTKMKGHRGIRMGEQ